MVDYNPTAADAATGNGDPIPTIDGSNEPSSTTKPKEKRPRRVCQTEGCSNLTAAISGLCKDCKPAGSKKKDQSKPSSKAKKAIKTALEDGEEDDSRSRTNSILPTPEPNSDPSDKVVYPASPSSLPPPPARRSVYSPPSTSITPPPRTSGLHGPASIKNEDVQEQEDGSPTPADRSITAQPIIEIATSVPRKRNVEAAGFSAAEGDEGDILHDEGSRKQRKLTPALEQQDTDHDADVDSNQSQLYQPSLTPEQAPKPTPADESVAIKDFQAAFANSAKADQDQLTEFKAAQKEQYDAMEAARITKTDAMTTARNEFIDRFKAVQEARDNLEGDLVDWKDKYAKLEVDLKTTEEQRDGWMSEKERLDREKDEVENERDEWKAGKEQLEMEKVKVEEAKLAAEMEANEEIAKLKEKVEKLKKAKADLIKSLSAADSD